ncbi:hypothetical protein [Bizionia myxarmorum]|uniref:Uncharacterized protein n=1 Tax=Bizionia myxarmorum TaxID=291186 RepID=A0A5D0RC12_9FLAO|nr:hypothetical protein [Bizionia myxarmorum]TYB78315.1 hypothetical protein ES674_00615 [Bizionia myxarmorum]
MSLIDQKIKLLYVDKQEFANKIGVPYKNLASKLRTVENKIEYANEFLNHLDLEVIITEKTTSENKDN